MGGKSISINVQRMKPVGKGKVMVKIRETSVNLTDMSHNGQHYKVLRSLGRGRYVMRPV